MIINGFDISKIKSEIVYKLLDAMPGNLVAVILAGSFPDAFKKGWSDIDLLIVVNQLNHDTKILLAKVISLLENKTGIHHGVNIIAKDEFVMPILPEIMLEGKTLQALMGLKANHERILYLNESVTLNMIYTPNADIIKQYSLSNIGMFLKRNRRSLSTTLYTSKNSKELLKREIRASLIITKLAVQYFSGKVLDKSDDLMNKAMQMFPDFRFDVIKNNFQIIENWSTFNDDIEILEVFRKVDEYIEKFAFYIFEKSK